MKYTKLFIFALTGLGVLAYTKRKKIAYATIGTLAHTEAKIRDKFKKLDETFLPQPNKTK